MKAQTVTIERDQHDYLLTLGRQQGTSRILGADSMSKLVERFRPPLEDSMTLPWSETEQSVRFTPGRWSVWSGPTFSGKTQLLRQTVLHAAKFQNRRTMFISLEEEPDEVWREFTCLAVGTRYPSQVQVRAAQELFRDRIWVFDSTEMVDPTLLLGIIRFGIERFGFSQIVVDSLMRLGLRSDDYEGQRELGNNLGRFVKLTRTHLHLVAHPRKTQNSRDAMDLYDIGGAQSLVAQADCVLTLERQHKPGEPTNVLTLWKQRGDVNWIGKLKLWYCQQSRQLRYSETATPIRYVPCASVAQIAQPSRDELNEPFPEFT